MRLFGTCLGLGVSLGVMGAALGFLSRCRQDYCIAGVGPCKVYEKMSNQPTGPADAKTRFRDGLAITLSATTMFVRESIDLSATITQGQQRPFRYYYKPPGASE